jgi:acrylyl-CoA reductase (NADPH)
MPFILRNVSLRGVDSVYCPIERRTEAWRRLSRELPDSAFEEIGRLISLSEVPGAAADIIAGKIRGRTLVDPNL